MTSLPFAAVAADRAALLKVVLVRTVSGNALLKERSKVLSGRSRMLLFAVDGKMTYGDLLEATGDPQANGAKLDALLLEGHITFRGAAAHAPVPSASGEAAKLTHEGAPAKAVPSTPARTGALPILAPTTGRTSVLLREAASDAVPEAMDVAKAHAFSTMRQVLGADADMIFAPLLSANSRSDFLREVMLCHQVLADMESKFRADTFLGEIEGRLNGNHVNTAIGKAR
jgi:hypothetical protein